MQQCRVVIPHETCWLFCFCDKLCGVQGGDENGETSAPEPSERDAASLSMHSVYGEGEGGYPSVACMQIHLLFYMRCHDVQISAS